MALLCTLARTASMTLMSRHVQVSTRMVPPTELQRMRSGSFLMLRSKSDHPEGKGFRKEKSQRQNTRARSNQPISGNPTGYSPFLHDKIKIVQIDLKTFADMIKKTYKVFHRLSTEVMSHGEVHKKKYQTADGTGVKKERNPKSSAIESDKKCANKGQGGNTKSTKSFSPSDTPLKSSATSQQPERAHVADKKYNIQEDIKKINEIASHLRTIKENNETPKFFAVKSAKLQKTLEIKPTLVEIIRNSQPIDKTGAFDVNRRNNTPSLLRKECAEIRGTNFIILENKSCSQQLKSVNEHDSCAPCKQSREWTGVYQKKPTIEVKQKDPVIQGAITVNQQAKHKSSENSHFNKKHRDNTLSSETVDGYQKPVPLAPQKKDVVKNRNIDSGPVNTESVDNISRGCKPTFVLLETLEQNMGKKYGKDKKNFVINNDNPNIQCGNKSIYSEETNMAASKNETKNMQIKKAASDSEHIRKKWDPKVINTGFKTEVLKSETKKEAQASIASTKRDISLDSDRNDAPCQQLNEHMNVAKLDIPQYQANKKDSIDSQAKEMELKYTTINIPPKVQKPIQTREEKTISLIESAWGKPRTKKESSNGNIDVVIAQKDLSKAQPLTSEQKSSITDVNNIKLKTKQDSPVKYQRNENHNEEEKVIMPNVQPFISPLTEKQSKLLDSLRVNMSSQKKDNEGLSKDAIKIGKKNVSQRSRTASMPDSFSKVPIIELKTDTKGAEPSGNSSTAVGVKRRKVCSPLLYVKPEEIKTKAATEIKKPDSKTNKASFASMKTPKETTISGNSNTNVNVTDFEMWSKILLARMNFNKQISAAEPLIPDLSSKHKAAGESQGKDNKKNVKISPKDPLPRIDLIETQSIKNLTEDNPSNQGIKNTIQMEPVDRWSKLRKKAEDSALDKKLDIEQALISAPKVMKSRSVADLKADQPEKEQRKAMADRKYTNPKIPQKMYEDIIKTYLESGKKSHKNNKKSTEDTARQIEGSSADPKSHRKRYISDRSDNQAVIKSKSYTDAICADKVSKSHSNEKVSKSPSNEKLAQRKSVSNILSDSSRSYFESKTASDKPKDQSEMKSNTLDKSKASDTNAVNKYKNEKSEAKKFGFLNTPKSFNLGDQFKQDVNRNESSLEDQKKIIDEYEQKLVQFEFALQKHRSLLLQAKKATLKKIEKEAQKKIKPAELKQ